MLTTAAAAMTQPYALAAYLAFALLTFAWMVGVSVTDKRARVRNPNFEAEHAAAQALYFRTVVLPKMRAKGAL